MVDDAAHLRRGGDAHDPDAALRHALVVGEGDDVGAVLARRSGARAVAEVPNSGPRHQGCAAGLRALAIGLDGAVGVPPLS